VEDMRSNRAKQKTENEIRGVYTHKTLSSLSTRKGSFGQDEPASRGVLLRPRCGQLPLWLVSRSFSFRILQVC
jgi:hypothetical protein